MANSTDFFIDDFGHIIVFVFICLGVAYAMGAKGLYTFLLVIFLGMIMVNWSKISKYIGGYVNG
jgi:cell division protein FtsW (lipid II flippase)